MRSLFAWAISTEQLLLLILIKFVTHFFKRQNYAARKSVYHLSLSGIWLKVPFNLIILKLFACLELSVTPKWTEEQRQVTHNILLNHPSKLPDTFHWLIETLSCAYNVLCFQHHFKLHGLLDNLLIRAQTLQRTCRGNAINQNIQSSSSAHWTIIKSEKNARISFYKSSTTFGTNKLHFNMHWTYLIKMHNKKNGKERNWEKNEIFSVGILFKREWIMLSSIYWHEPNKSLLIIRSFGDKHVSALQFWSLKCVGNSILN